MFCLPSAAQRGFRAAKLPNATFSSLDFKVGQVLNERRMNLATFVTTDKVRLFYRLEGNDDRPVLVFSHSLGTDSGMWDLQVADLLPYFRILRYDTRGHGGSSVPDGEYTMEQLGRDVLSIADALQIEKFAFCARAAHSAG